MKSRKTIVFIFLIIICFLVCYMGCSNTGVSTQKLDPESLARQEAIYPAIKSIMEKHGISDFEYYYPDDVICAQFEKLTSREKWQLMKDLSEMRIKYPNSDTYSSPLDMPNIYIKRGDTSYYYYISEITYSSARIALSMTGGDPNQATYPGVYYHEETKKGAWREPSLVYREEDKK